ncbi:hypothetical protein B0H17DRAFT_1195272 [Mycena rosella]|uniref:NAD-dependent epimerase/dehydratase domain-containing protein n=1 Tax=Mycena rosella TaxID=1033263 RepID=A0AAD7DWK1_MYCRO|nr:hypothetical protein B0H17DRAFT_1195272 [Mycena rosella]
MSTESKPLVFVTGAAGFLGFQVVYQLLEAGYAVRGAARGRKIPLLKKAFEKYARFEVVEIADIATSDYTAALKGVGAIIHTAAPLPGRTDSNTALKTGIEGCLRILREAEKAGVKKIVATGSMITFPENAYGPDDWVPVTKEQAVDGNSFVVYTAEKKFGEQAMVEFANTHPEMEITIFCPPWIFGPLAPGFEHIVPEPDFAALSTNGYIYQLLRSNNVNYHPLPHGVLDIRDVARIHIAGLNPLIRDHPKRIALGSPYPANFQDAIKYISDSRPELRERLADPSTAPVWPSHKLDIDFAPLEKAFGISLDSYKTWKETILDAVDTLIEVEKQWIIKGFKVEVPTAPPM